MKSSEPFGFAQSEFTSVILDLDETLAPTLTPISHEMAKELVFLIKTGVDVAVVTMQSIGEVRKNLIDPITDYASAHSITQAKEAIHVYCCGGACGFMCYPWTGQTIPLYEITGVRDCAELIKVALGDLLSDGEYIYRGFSVSFHYFKPDRALVLESLRTRLAAVSLPVDVIQGLHFLPRGVDKSFAVAHFARTTGLNPTKTLVIGDSFEEEGIDWGMCLQGSTCVSVGTLHPRVGYPVLHFSQLAGFRTTQQILIVHREYALAKSLAFACGNRFEKWMRVIYESGMDINRFLAEYYRCRERQASFSRLGLVPEELREVASALGEGVGDRRCVFIAHGASALYEAYNGFGDADLIRLPRFSVVRRNGRVVPSPALGNGISLLVPEQRRHQILSRREKDALLADYARLSTIERLELDNDLIALTGTTFQDLVAVARLAVGDLVKAVAPAGLDRAIIRYSELVDQISIFDTVMTLRAGIDYAAVEEVLEAANVKLNSVDVFEDCRRRMLRSLREYLLRRVGSSVLWDINFEYHRLAMDECGLKDLLRRFSHSSRRLLRPLLADTPLAQAGSIAIVDDACATGSSYISAAILARILSDHQDVLFVAINSVSEAPPDLVDLVLINDGRMYQDTRAETFSLLFFEGAPEAHPVCHSSSSASFARLKARYKSELGRILAISPGRRDVAYPVEDYVLAYALGDRAEVSRRFVYDFLFNDGHGELLQIDWAKRMDIERRIESLADGLAFDEGADSKGALEAAKSIEISSFQTLFKRHLSFLAEMRRK